MTTPTYKFPHSTFAISMANCLGEDTDADSNEPDNYIGHAHQLNNILYPYLFTQVIPDLDHPSSRHLLIVNKPLDARAQLNDWRDAMGSDPDRTENLVVHCTRAIYDLTQAIHDSCDLTASPYKEWLALSPEQRIERGTDACPFTGADTPVDMRRLLDERIIQPAFLYRPLDCLICRLVRVEDAVAEIMDHFTLYAHQSEGVYY